MDSAVSRLLSMVFEDYAISGYSLEKSADWPFENGYSHRTSFNNCFPVDTSKGRLWTSKLHSDEKSGDTVYMLRKRLDNNKAYLESEDTWFIFVK